MLLPTTKLYNHQQSSVFQFHIRAPKTADWSDCGVGKSLMALAKFDALYHNGLVNYLLIVCPLSVMYSWREEIEKHTDFKVTTLTGTTDQRIRKLDDDSQVYLSTYDGITGRGKSKYALRFAILNKFKGDNMIVCDEATMIKSVEAKRTLSLVALCDDIRYSMFLSGTFIPQDLQDIFTIYRAMDGGATFGVSINAARNEYMKNTGGPFPKWELKPERRDEFLRKLYELAIRLRKEDCIDLPEKVHEVRRSDIDPKQMEHYNSIRENLYTVLDTKETIKVESALSRIGKMQQVLGGFIYDKNKKPNEIPTKKLDLLGEIMSQVGEDKVIIYALYKEELFKIRSHLTSLGYQSSLLYGSLSDSERATNIKAFRTNPNVKALVAQISTGGYGLTVVEANHIIYYSMSFSLTDYRQSQDRIHRIGQTKTCIYHYLLTQLDDTCKVAVDEYVYRSLIKNFDVATAIEDLKDLKKLKEIL